MTAISEKSLFDLAMEVDAATGIRLEMVSGIPIWEAHPNTRHQRTVRDIERSIRPAPNSDTGCECAYLSDVYVRFPDGSLKRPDISIFCREPEEDDEPVSMVPAAVIEILSRGYEAKDLEMGVALYLKHSIRDIVIVDPRSGRIVHYVDGVLQEGWSPVEIGLQCGCVCRV
jgi:Uma2 family endonuclease